MTETQAPLSSESRIVTIDALRGFALFGILFSHMIFWYTAGPLPERLFKEGLDVASMICMGLYSLFFLGKFFSFFSFLFGLSFYIQLKSLQKNKDNFFLRYGWRLLILGVIGLIHHAIWRGDILSIYAPLGLLLLLTHKLSNKTILVIGFILILNIPTKIYEAAKAIVEVNPVNPHDEMAKDGEHYFDIVKNGSFIAVVKDNWNALDDKMNYQLTSGRLIITFGFFLFGMYAGRQRWFENLNEAKPLIKKYWKKISYSLLILVGIAVLAAILNFTLNLNLMDNKWGMWFLGFIADGFNSGLTLFYIAGLTLLMYRDRWQKIVYPLASVGKMALSSYLMQTFFGVLLFHHFGLGLFTETTPAQNSLICLGLFIFQVIFSKWWLQHFTYGPVEWLWRSLTFLKAQPFLKNKDHQLVPEPLPSRE